MKIDLSSLKPNDNIIFVPMADDIIMWDLWDYSINTTQLIMRDVALKNGYTHFKWLVVDVTTREVLTTVESIN